jgi:trimethylguanosine synthase
MTNEKHMATTSASLNERDNEEEENGKEYHYERNNSLPELFGDEAHQQAWEKYWAKNGERLIWQSWIEKYIEYINPEYLDQSKSLLGIIDSDAQKCEPPPNNSTEIVISSPVKQSAEDLMIQGWSELTPDSLRNETNLPRYLHQNSNDTDNFLLSPRCDSINSSIPFTIGTTDSMTNVTRMTISSFGFESSHVTSESTPTSSTSSLEKQEEEEDSDKVSSFSDSEYDSDNQMATTRAAHECEKLLMENKPAEHLPSANDKDSEEYWQKRWQSHAQEQYVKHYNTFMETHRILQEEMSSSFKSDSGFLPGENNAGCSGSGGGGGNKRRKKSGRKKGSHSLQRLVANLNMKNDLVKFDNPQKHTEQVTDGDSHQHQEQSQSDSTVIDATESSLMESMGLPTSFGRRENGKSGNGGGDEPPDERPLNLKRSHESETDEAHVDHIKSQFEMMGYAFNDNNEGAPTTITKGEIVYRKKHVRLHNRMLKMFTSVSRPRHTYFDDDGNEIVEEKEQEQENLLHSSSDEDAPIIQPPTNRINNNNSIVPLTSQLSSDGNANDENEIPEEQVNINLSIDQENDCVEEPIIGMNEDVEDRQQQLSAKREKKKKRKGKFQTIIPVEIANDKVLKKYWYKRFSLFSMFDQGIQLDRGELKLLKIKLSATKMN